MLTSLIGIDGVAEAQVWTIDIIDDGLGTRAEKLCPQFVIIKYSDFRFSYDTVIGVGRVDLCSSTLVRSVWLVHSDTF